MTTEPTLAKVQLTDGLGAGAEARKTVRLECRLCGGRYTATLPWQGRPQGPQCQCNPNTWGNWKRVDAGALREGCNYMATAGSVCNKCGHVHEAPNARVQPP
jgi:hypothetical protein